QARFRIPKAISEAGLPIPRTSNREITWRPFRSSPMMSTRCSIIWRASNERDRRKHRIAAQRSEERRTRTILETSGRLLRLVLFHHASGDRQALHRYGFHFSAAWRNRSPADAAATGAP